MFYTTLNKVKALRSDNKDFKNILKYLGKEQADDEPPCIEEDFRNIFCELD